MNLDLCSRLDLADAWAIIGRVQQERGLNQDVTVFPEKSEGEKLRGN